MVQLRKKQHVEFGWEIKFSIWISLGSCMIWINISPMESLLIFKLFQEPDMFLFRDIYDIFWQLQRTLWTHYNTVLISKLFLMLGLYIIEFLTALVVLVMLRFLTSCLHRFDGFLVLFYIHPPKVKLPNSGCQIYTGTFININICFINIKVASCS